MQKLSAHTYKDNTWYWNVTAVGSFTRLPCHRADCRQSHPPLRPRRGGGRLHVPRSVEAAGALALEGALDLTAGVGHCVRYVLVGEGREVVNTSPNLTKEGWREGGSSTTNYYVNRGSGGSMCCHTRKGKEATRTRERGLGVQAPPHPPHPPVCTLTYRSPAGCGEVSGGGRCG